MIEKEYWANLLPPLAPSELDVIIYKENMLIGSTLLLGSTRQLIRLSNVQMDINPQDYLPNPINQDWLTNINYYDNIIGDGVTVFNKELCDGIIKMASECCKKLIIRSFNKKLPITRIASYFPMAEDFIIHPTIIKIFDEYTFYIWQF